MKRLLWCLCLCALCPTLIIGCGDDESSGSAEDGGVSQDDLMDIENQITMIGSDLGDLTDNVGELGEEVTSIGNDLDSLTEEADRRLTDLEMPDILSCSVSEVCIPDGVDMVSGENSKLGEIIEVICEHEVDCCDETELNLKFGPGIEDAADCVNLFNDVVQNGFTPDFFSSYLTPSVVYQIIGVAQALNDPRVHVEIDEAGVEACVESLQAECPEISEPGEPGEPECVAPEAYAQDPCSLDNLLNGLQEEGELCGDYAVGEGEDIPECDDGFYCSFEAYTNNNQGICAKLPDVGDFCQSDPDCDPFGYYGYNYGGPNVTNLYCNINDAQCAPLGDVGDDCTFIDEDFAINDPSNLQPQSRSATSQDCLPFLTCDPSSNTCVALCSEGRFCTPGADPLLTCGDDLLCNVTEVPALYDTWGMGTCAPAIEEGDTCTQGFECETGKCEDDCDPDTELCNCSESRAPGEECDTPGADPLCRSSWCGTDSECADTCNCDENAEDGDCDMNVGEGPSVMSPCGDGYFCDFGTYVGNDAQNYSLYACEPRIANGGTCDASTNVHASCASGFCDPATNQCTAKVAIDAACPSMLDEQCRTNQYCNASNICRTYLAAGANCDLADVTLLECAKGLVCVDAGTDTCQALAESGEACNPSNIAEPRCNSDEDPTLGCIDIDGGASGLVLECYSYMGGYADGVDCQFQDSYCASGWCRPNAVLSPTASSCTQPLEEGDDCDISDQTQDVCAEGLYCNHPQNETAGKCAQQRGPGGACKPYFGGDDCRYGGSCTFTKDQYLCNAASIDYSTEIFCGGN
jgi:hypothetical protein